MEIDKVRGVFGLVVIAFFLLCGFRDSRPEPAREIPTIEIKSSPAPIVRKTVDHFIEDVSSAIKVRGYSANLLRALIYQESGGNPEARRAEPKLRTASIGLTQVLGTTARNGYGVRAHELKDPETSVWVGALYLKDCIAKEGDVFFGLACYNAGPKKRRSLYPAKSLQYARSVLALKKIYDRGDDPRYGKK